MSRSKHTKTETTEGAAPDAGPVEGSAAPDAAPPVSEAEARIREAEERALRAQADLQNVKRRHREEIDRIRDTATKDLVVALLPVIDDLERAIAASSETQNTDALRTGVDLTMVKLVSALKSVGVERMPGVGAAFDPNFHEAVVQTAPSEEHPNGTISQELRPGYTQHGHVIRPSMVAVAHE